MSWIKIDYDNPPKGTVLLLTSSKKILKGDWFENSLVKGFGWRTEKSRWMFYPPDGNEGLSLTPMSEIQYYYPLPSIDLNESESSIGSGCKEKTIIELIIKEFDYQQPNEIYTAQEVVDIILEYCNLEQGEKKLLSIDEQTIGKKFFYAGFEKALKSDANCFEAWREEAPKLFNSIK